jgi:hypothetical protein
MIGEANLEGNHIRSDMDRKGIDRSIFKDYGGLASSKLRRSEGQGSTKGRTHVAERERRRQGGIWLCVAWWQDTDDIARSNERTNERTKQAKSGQYNRTRQFNKRITARPEERGQQDPARGSGTREKILRRWKHSTKEEIQKARHQHHRHASVIVLALCGGVGVRGGEA